MKSQESLEKKIKILSFAAKYDASCASSGSERSSKPGTLGTTSKIGVCHSWSEDGRCISLLKVLLTNNCMYDCAYCVNRSSNQTERARFTPDEIAELTIQFYLRNYIEGLFLSSAIFRTPDYTMEQMIEAVKLLRTKYKFNGYIHIKAMPGADPLLLTKAGHYADRMSANIELPTQKSLSYLAPEKTGDQIFSSMSTIQTSILERNPNTCRSTKNSDYLPAGQSTQLIVGASPESDKTIIKLSEALYNKYRLRRVYYSAYITTVNYDERLPTQTPPLKRENLLYQADWLLRFYGFKADELLSKEYPNFDYALDPKSFWALIHFYQFPVEVNSADYEILLRVPGIGLRSAQSIIKARRTGSLDFDSLKKIGVVLKRARYFITCKGKHLESRITDPNLIRMRLDRNRQNRLSQKMYKQINDGQQLLFAESIYPQIDYRRNALSGEI